MLPLAEWKSLRVISFTWDKTKVEVAYYKTFTLDSIRQENVFNPKTNQEETRNYVPLDELDMFLLDSFRTSFPDAIISDCIISGIETQNLIERKYKNTLSRNVKLILMPGYSEDVYWNEGKEFKAHNIMCPVHFFGRISETFPDCIEYTYEIGKYEYYTALMTRLKKEIQFL